MTEDEKKGAEEEMGSAGEMKKEDLHKIAKDLGLNPKTTTLGIGEKIESALCYILLFISGIIFLIIEKDNKFVRFHAIQSMATFLPLYIIVSQIEKIMYIQSSGGYMLNIFGLLITGALSIVMSTLMAILWLLLIYKASKGEKYKLPIVGRIAERYA